MTRVDVSLVVVVARAAAAVPGITPQRLVNKADFERLLAVRSMLRSAHFAVHHVVGAPHVPVWQPAAAVSLKLSTDSLEQPVRAVDDSMGDDDGAVRVAPVPQHQQWLGCVVPKRLARRAVTRNLIKRQVRGAFHRMGNQLPSGLWLVRLRAPFPVSTFVSARSTALAKAVRDELDALLKRAHMPSRPGAA